MQPIRMKPDVCSMKILVKLEVNIYFDPRLYYEIRETFAFCIFFFLLLGFRASYPISLLYEFVRSATYVCECVYSI